ncbi:DUF378 domain-containing protein [Candidatus Woesearchaeota archaeon]|nr:DUF378 domain-containing protein [Candidatus Woesearchaeota archaeon]
MAGMGQLDTVSKWLVLVGGLNWGLVGVGGFAGSDLNVVKLVLGSIAGGAIEKVVYVLVGLSALYMLYGMFGKK